jgi:hypothetical protein
MTWSYGPRFGLLPCANTERKAGGNAQAAHTRCGCLMRAETSRQRWLSLLQLARICFAEPNWAPQARAVIDMIRNGLVLKHPFDRMVLSWFSK